MPWWNDTASALGWLSSEVFFGGRSPQEEARQIQQAGEMLGGLDTSSWMRYYGDSSHGVGVGFYGPDLGRILGMVSGLSMPGSAPGGTGQQVAPNQAATTPGLAGVPKNVDSATIQGILRAAQELGVDPSLAIAIARQESNFNASAVGDHGCSVGVFQLNTCGGEGAGLPDYILHDPYQNAKVALAVVAQVQHQHPDWSPGQIAAAAQRPANQSGYAESVNNWVSQIQTGQGDLGGWANKVVGSPTFGGANRANQFGASNQVPAPFASDFFSKTTLKFGEHFQGSTEMGIDYAMPEGSTLSTPVGGIVHLEDTGRSGWGKRVIVKTPSGWSFAIGHVQQFTVSEGEQISPGAVLGTSGGGPKSPSPGASTGPHIEVQFIDPTGHYQDPQPFMQQLYAGVNFSQWAGGVFVGSASVIGQQGTPVRTPDGKLIDYNTPEGQWYRTVDNIWQSVYGQHAPLQAALDFRTAGITTTDALTNAVNQLPSSIAGVTIGQYKIVSDAAQKTAAQAFGRAVPQSLIQQFFQKGITSAADIRLWAESHGSSDIPQADYQSIYDSALSYTMGLNNDVPHPDDVTAIWQQSGGTPSAPQNTQQQDVAKTIADYTAGVY